MSLETLRELCAEMVTQESEKTRLEDELKAVNIRLDILRKNKIPEMMEQIGVRTATFSGIGRVQLAPDLYASTKEGQKDAAMTWLRDLGYEDMITETYNASSLKALFRRMIVDAQPIPDEIFNVTPFTRASIVKG